MKIEPVISFHGMESSDAVTTRIRERLERLERFHDCMTACHVAVEAPQQGRVIRVFADEGYGFIDAWPGREICFQRNNVVEGGWELIDTDVDVRFTEVEGKKGPHAHNVTVIGSSNAD